MIEAFWKAIDFLVKVVFTGVCVVAGYWISQVPPRSDDAALVQMGLYGMLVAFVALVWTYEKWH